MVWQPNSKGEEGPSDDRQNCKENHRRTAPLHGHPVYNSLKEQNKIHSPGPTSPQLHRVQMEKLRSGAETPPTREYQSKEQIIIFIRICTFLLCGLFYYVFNIMCDFYFKYH